MAILKVEPNAINSSGAFAFDTVNTTGNVTVGGQLIINNTILPTTANVIDIGTPTMRFGTLYLAGNTIDLGGTLISTDPVGTLTFTTETGNVAITANTVSFLNTVANTATETGNIAFDGNVHAYAVYTDSYFYANGAAFTGSKGYTGSAGTNGYAGSKGDTGLGFTIAKSYSSVAALTADTAPTGIVAGQFAIIETGSVNDADNSKLYLWSGSAYSYVNDLSGAAGITGPAGYTGSASSVAGYTGSSGALGYTGSAGTAGSAGSMGYTGSAGVAGSIGYTGSAGSAGNTGYTGSAGTAGTTGYTGSAGTAGNTGTTGYTGSAGAGYTGSAGTNGYTGSQGAAGSGYINLSMVGAISPPFTGTARFYSPTDVTINTVYANLSAAPTSGNLNFVIKKNGVSIGTTFVLSSALMTPVSVNISLVTTDYLTMDVTGSAASDLYVRLKYV